MIRVISEALLSWPLLTVEGAPSQAKLRSCNAEVRETLRLALGLQDLHWKPRPGHSRRPRRVRNETPDSEVFHPVWPGHQHLDRKETSWIRIRPDGGLS